MDVTRTDSVWRALCGHPLRFLGSRWALRALAYTASGVPIGLATLVWLPVSLVLGAGALTPLAIWPLATLDRRRLALLGGPPVPDPCTAPTFVGLRPWLRARQTRATRRELGYALLNATVLLVADAVATYLAVGVPIVTIVAAVTVAGAAAPVLFAEAVIVAVIGGYTVALVAVGHGEVARNLLGPGDEDTVRILTRSRARLIDAFEVERRRIERDLHDGAQQRLVALTITLGLAELEHGNAAATHALLTKAAAQSRAALADLRDLVRGIHPQVLTDLGLSAAVGELANGCGVPLTIAIDLPSRLPSTVESAAYFVVAEAISNTVKHAGATRAWVTGALAADRLVVEVGDDGVGGADPGRGTGLAGLADRVDALAGSLTVASPAGGPTVLRLELPCSA